MCYLPRGVCVQTLLVCIALERTHLREQGCYVERGVRVRTARAYTHFGSVSAGQLCARAEAQAAGQGRGCACVRICIPVCVPPPQLPACVTRKHNPCSRQGMAVGWLTPGSGAGAAEDGEQPDGAELSSGHPWARSRCFGPQ